MAKIYISSTYEDLEKEREAAAKAIRRLGHTTVAMEDYVAADKRPVDKCLEDVRNCDVYVGIFAWRYGFIPDGYDKSITHLEYEEAGKAGKECLIFLLDEDAEWSVKKIDKGEKRDKIERLRNELQERHGVSFFKNADQLSGLVSPAVTLLKLDTQKTSPAIKTLWKIEEDFKKPEDLIGKRFGKYVIKEKLGRDHEEEVPVEVKSLESKAQKIYKNEKGFWEADYGDGIIMVYIPAGEFKMGQTEEEKQWLIDHIGEKDYNEYIKNELPLHTVYLDGYWMGKTEVTVKQFRIFVEAKGYKTDAEKSRGAITWTGEECEHKEGITWKNPGFKQDDNHPVVCVSRNDVRAYCEWLSNKRGLSFKLPTEAQWEKAARGTDSRKYPWGNHEPFYNGKWHANYAVHDNWEQRGEDGFEFTSPVGSYPQGASPYGLLDMAGNVWEWCEDWYEGDYYRKSPIKNPKGPEKRDFLVVRGGCWSYKARYLRCAQRGNVKHSNRYDYVGFRLCQDNREPLE